MCKFIAKRKIYDNVIREQWGKVGIPSERDLPKESKKSVSTKSNGSSKDEIGAHV